MLNPDDLVAAWVAKLRGIQELVLALDPGGSPDSILAYQDVYPGETNLRRGILQQPPGSLMVVWQGVGPRKLQGALYFQHQFSIIVKAPIADVDTVSYGALCALIVNGISTVDPDAGLKMLIAKIHPACEPMNLDLPAARRQTLLVSLDGETLDYFEITASLMEIGDN